MILRDPHLTNFAFICFPIKAFKFSNVNRKNVLLCLKARRWINYVLQVKQICKGVIGITPEPWLKKA